MLLPISNVPRDYAWGSPTLLADLQGRAATGAPEAEIWFGDHRGDPSDLGDGRTLDQLTGGSLPYLLKLLAAGSPLSIQVHPTRVRAEAGFARESALAADAPERNYRDANHKPELIVALSDRFEALVGLRPRETTLRLVDTLGARSGVVSLRSRVATDAPLSDTIGWLLSGAGTSEVGDVIAAVQETSVPEFAAELAAVRAIAARYPADPGVVVALLMNYVELRRGEAVFLRAGVLHAYLSGLGVEIMAASDNVLRGGLTAKHVDVPELLAVLDATPGGVVVQRPDADVWAFEVPVPDFALTRVSLSGSPVRVPVAGPAIVLATAGGVSVATDASAPVGVPVGTAVFATTDEPVLILSGAGEAFIAALGA